MPVTNELLFQRSLKRWSWYFIGAIVFICLIVLSGWFLDYPLKFSPELMLLPMNPLSALCFLAACASFILCNRESKSRLCYILASTTAAAVVIIGALRLSDNFFNDFFNLDALLLKDHPALGNLAGSRGRMTTNAAFNFVLSGTALLLYLPDKKKFSILYSYIAIIIGLFTLFFLVGYFYNIRQVNETMRFFPMSVSTSCCFIFLSLALLFAQPDKNLMRSLSSKTPGGAFARVVIPLTIIIPVLLGYFLLTLSEKYAITPGFEITLFVVTMIAFFFFLYWYSSSLLNKIDQHKVLDDLRIKQLNEELERKVLERTEELSEYKYALDASSIIVTTDANGIIQQVNDNYCRISKFNREDVVGKGHSIVNPRIHPVAVIDNLWHTITRGRIWRGELRNFNRNGEEYWLETTIVPLLNEDHKPRQYLLINTDITERKTAAEKILSLNESLIRKEKKLNGLLENNDELIAMVDQDFKIIYRSPNYERITGYNKTDTTVLNTVDLIDSEDVPELHVLGAKLMEKPGVSIPLEFRMRHKDGYYMWMEGYATNLLQDESVQGIVFNIRNVSERKANAEKLIRSEKIYRTIAANIPESTIIIFDEERRYLLIEGNLALAFGYERSQMIGKYYEDVLNEPHRSNVTADLNRVFKGEKFSREIITHQNNYIASYVPLKDDADHIYAAMLVFSDISEIKSAQKQIAELNNILEKRVQERTRQLEQINKELEAFTYSVSHDLRAPLRIIVGFADFLGQDYLHLLDTGGKRKLEAIQRNASRMNGLIDDLLKLSGIGKKPLRLDATDMNELIQSVLQEYPENIQQYVNVDLKGLNISFCDPNLMRQVWSNLISNAVKYSSKKNHPEIFIAAEQKEDHITYHIRDNGAGFDPVYAGKLFTVFQRLHNSSEFEGTGIGLALVQRIVSRHNGQVWATGKIDEGATFYFSLPEN